LQSLPRTWPQRSILRGFDRRFVVVIFVVVVVFVVVGMSVAVVVGTLWFRVGCSGRVPSLSLGQDANVMTMMEHLPPPPCRRCSVS